MASILLVVKHAQLEHKIAQDMRRIELETSVEQPVAAKGATAGGDSRKLRGLPAIARGVEGAIPGTSPHHLR